MFPAVSSNLSDSVVHVGYSFGSCLAASSSTSRCAFGTIQVQDSLRVHTCFAETYFWPMSQIKLFVTCAEYNKCRPYHEMLTYKPLTNSAVQERVKEIFTK
jgi:hypothetical protein